MENTEEREPPNVIEGDLNHATKIKPEEAPDSHKYKFRKFRAYNRGTWNGPKRENKELVHHQDNLHRYDAIASSLPLTDYQRKRGRSVFERLNLKKLGLRVDLVVFAVCVIVANDEARNTRYWPSEKKTDNDPKFKKKGSELSLTAKEQRKTIQKVMNRVDF